MPIDDTGIGGIYVGLVLIFSHPGGSYEIEDVPELFSNAWWPF